MEKAVEEFGSGGRVGAGDAPELGFQGRGAGGARGRGAGKGEEDGGGARARGRRMGAGVTTEELGGGDGGGGAIFRQPFGSKSRARGNKKICASSGTYIAHGLTAAGNIIRPPR